MTHVCTLQLHAQGVWHDVASVRLSGDVADGWKAKTYSGYAIDWAFTHAGATDASALCAGWPVGLEPLQLNHWPVFLIDMLPQGFGRQELLQRIGLSPVAGVPADWQLLLAGAGNPIGHLRVKEAAQWLNANAGAQRGFTYEEVAQRGDARRGVPTRVGPAKRGVPCGPCRPSCRRWSLGTDAPGCSTAGCRRCGGPRAAGIRCAA